MDAELLKAIADLAWPVLAAIILLALLPTIAKVLRSRGVTIKYGNMKLSVQDASDQLRKQVEDIQNQLRDLTAQEVAAKPAGDDPGNIESPEEETAPEHRLILWVDDKPTNNAHEIAKLQKDGYDISTAESTAAALTLLQGGTTKPDIIISDMGRREGLGYNRNAGIDLVRSIRAQGLDTPIYIYSSAKTERKYAEEVRKAGGNGITSSPIKLFKFVASGAYNTSIQPTR
jgi:CheY-like chemotaxis protein